MEQSFGDSKQNRLANQVGWPVFKRARRLKWTDQEVDTPMNSNGGDTTTSATMKKTCDNKMKSPSPTRGQSKLAHKQKKSIVDPKQPLRILWSFILVSSLVVSVIKDELTHHKHFGLAPYQLVEASLIIGDSAIEIQEVDDKQAPNEPNLDQQLKQQQQQNSLQPHEVQFGQSDFVLGSTGSQQHKEQPSALLTSTTILHSNNNNEQAERFEMSRVPSGPLPPLGKPPAEDITDGDKKSRNSHDFDLNELTRHADRKNEREALSKVILGTRQPSSQQDYDVTAGPLGDKTITGKVVDFELQPAGGHNKAKIKKKKKKKKAEESFKKWGKKKKMEKKAMEKHEKRHMKKKKEEGKKGKKKWGLQVHGQKKKGDFKKKKWGEKVKKGKGIKKGKKGKKFLMDKGHKNTGFKTVYHKEEWGKSSKWHDIERKKKWDEKAKKWKKKWKKEKGKKYKGEHMKKFEKKKKEGKKYKKAKKEKFKKFKNEEFEKGKKKKMEEHKKKKEGGAKKEMKEMKKKKKP